MNDKVLSIVIRAQDQASKVMEKIGDSTSSMRDKVRAAATGMATLATGAGVALYGITGALKSTVEAANKSTAALVGLSSIARAFGVDADDAKSAAQSLAKDGLMTVGDAARGLKNLLASGFSLPQAITLMERFKDSAAFGRQGSLEFGDAIAQATEGIKNGNSILVDNAGVTKNLSMMLTEAGYSAQDLMKATTDTGVRMAIYNGILKETNAQQGDAVRLAGTFAGKQAIVGAQINILKQNIGAALEKALIPLVEAISPIIAAISDWVSHNQKLAAAIAIATTVTLALVVVIGGLVAAVGGMIAIFGSGAGIIIGAVLAIAAAIGAFTGLSVTKLGFLNDIFKAIQATVSYFGTIITTAFAMAKPAIDLVWNALVQLGGVVQSQLMPALNQLMVALGPILTPMLKTVALVLAGALVASILAAVAVLYVIIKVITLLVQVISTVISALARFVSAFVSAASGAANAVSSFISPIAGRIGAAISNMIGTAIAFGNQFINAFRNMGAQAVNAIIGALSSLPARVGSIISQAMAQIGAAPHNIAKTIESKFGIDIPGFATGGYTGRGNANQVAGVVHRGEYVVPKSQVDQSTGLPYGQTGTTFQFNAPITFSTAESVDRFFEVTKFKQELGGMGVGV